MLKLIQNGNIKKWIIESQYLRDWGLKSPQGFIFNLSQIQGLGNYFWTSNEFAAYLFYKRYQIADEETKKYFQARCDRDTYLYKLSYSTTSNKNYISPSNLTYRNYQKACIEYCQLADNVLIADYMRLGKTICVCGYINNTTNLTKILIICPKTAKIVWETHCKDWLIKNHNIQIISTKDEINNEANIYIINYDILHLKPELSNIEFDLIVADEIHKCKSPIARRSKFFAALKGKKRLGLSGTPLVNTPKDWLTVLKWIDPFWKQFYIYKDQFCSQSGFCLSLEEVQQLARSTCMIRRLQDQVFDVEPIERRVVPLEVPRSISHLVERQLISINDYIKIRRALGISKVSAALNHIDTYSSQGEKLIVFAYHNEVIERLSASLGTKAVTIYGGITDVKRKEAIERFTNDPDCTVFLGSIGAASEAINLSVSNHIIFVEQDFSNGQMEQAEERASDKNKTGQVLIIISFINWCVRYWPNNNSGNCYRKMGI